MTARLKFATITSSLSFKLFVVLFLTISVLFFIFATAYGHFHGRILEDQIKADAYRASDFIRQSLLTSMLRNEREDTYTIIQILGDEPGVEAIRIYNKQGEIKFSNDAAEIGQTVDLEAEACYACHASAQPLEALPSEERARIYHKDDIRVLALINPIPNQTDCSNAGCHAHSADQSVLGVLDVQMSMAAADAALATARPQTFGVALGIIALSLLFIAGILYRGVHVPTRELRRGTEALAQGDLDVKIDLQRSDELGALARSFNRMARNLKGADAELRTWSQTLEDRVHEKTEELEQFTQQMIRMEKTASLGKMAATVAHELNNPLTGIVTYAKVVGKRLTRLLPESKERSHLLEDLDAIRSESMRCGNIVRDLLTYARKGRTEFAPTQLHALIARALRLVRHHTELGHVTTVTEFELEDDRLVCDGDQIEQALVALLVNAVEAMPDGGQLTVSTRASTDDPAHRVVLRVADTGVGIPQNVQEHIFDPFFSTKHEAKGVGLGLAVVYGIVQRHEGHIQLDAEPTGGTAFTIDLPRDPEQTVRERTIADTATEFIT